MSSPYYDTTAIIQVIGCVFNNPALLDDTDKYTIHEQDFIEEFHKIVFGSIYNIHATGSSITIDAIVDYLDNRPKFAAVFKQNKGIEYLTQVSTVASEDTFNYYYNRLKKMTLLRAYANVGLDVTDLYDPSEVLDSKRKQKQEDWLDNSSLVDIADAIDARIESVKASFVDEELGLGNQAGDNIFELIESLRACPEVGIPLYGRLINTVTRGARLRKFYLRSAATGVGKAIPNDTLIPTPQGWRKVGDIKVGDYLFGQDGKLTKVLATYPQGEKDIWEVTFKDGRVAECCKDHLWTYRYESHRGHAYRTESLEEILERTSKVKNGLINSDGRGFRFHIPLNDMLEYPEKKFSVHPYVMGAFLGDASFRYTPSQKALEFSSKNDELPGIICSFMEGYTFKKASAYNYTYTFKPIDDLNHNLWVEEVLKDYPELWNVKSEDKFIPQEYLFGSIEQRFYLLEGLLDTDGTIDTNKGRVSFATVSPKLRDGVIELCRSLGMIANYGVDKREDKYTTGECYDIHIQCKKEMKPLLFRLSYKHERALKYAESKKREEHKDHLAIVDIKKTDRKAEMTCFTVDNESHLFLMNDFIVTHNTRAMIADACNFACDEIYDEQFGWYKNGYSEPTLFIATEQDLGEIQTMMLAFLSDVNEDHILTGRYLEGEYDRVIHASEILKRSNLWVEQLPDFSLQDVENKIKKHIREHDVKYVCFDYIQTSMKILEEVTRRSGGVKLREDNVLFMLSVRLKDLCNKYGIFIESATQLSGDYKQDDSPDQTLLRGAKSIADKVDYGSILLSVTNDDLVKLDPILTSGQFEIPNIKLSVYKNRRGPYKGVYLWCAANLGTCRIQPQFVTNYNHELLPIEDIKVIVDKESAF